MIARLNTVLRRHKLDQLYELISGKKTMREVKYSPRNFDDIHLSDLDWDGGCAIIPYFSRTEDGEFPFSDITVLRFLRGRIVERAIADELEPIMKDDIICTIDDYIEGIGYNEIKSTVKDCDSFDPITSYPHWLTRCKGYMKATEVERFNLTVLFWVGNVWTARKTGNPRIPVELKSWMLLPEEGEVDKNWEECLRRRDVLRKALDSGDPTELMEATRKLKPKWFGCDGCQYYEICPIRKEK